MTQDVTSLSHKSQTAHYPVEDDGTYLRDTQIVETDSGEQPYTVHHGTDVIVGDEQSLALHDLEARSRRIRTQDVDHLEIGDGIATTHQSSDVRVDDRHLGFFTVGESLPGMNLFFGAQVGTQENAGASALQYGASRVTANSKGVILAGHVMDSQNKYADARKVLTAAIAYAEHGPDTAMDVIDAARTCLNDFDAAANDIFSKIGNRHRSGTSRRNQRRKLDEMIGEMGALSISLGGEGTVAEPALVESAPYDQWFADYNQVDNYTNPAYLGSRFDDRDDALQHIDADADGVPSKIINFGMCNGLDNGQALRELYPDAISDQASNYFSSAAPVDQTTEAQPLADFNCSLGAPASQPQPAAAQGSRLGRWARGIAAGLLALTMATGIYMEETGQLDNGASNQPVVGATADQRPNPPGFDSGLMPTIAPDNGIIVTIPRDEIGPTHSIVASGGQGFYQIAASQDDGHSAWDLWRMNPRPNPNQIQAGEAIVVNGAMEDKVSYDVGSFPSDDRGLQHIVARFGADYDATLAANPDVAANPDHIEVGQNITIAFTR